MTQDVGVEVSKDLLCIPTEIKELPSLLVWSLTCSRALNKSKTVPSTNNLRFKSNKNEIKIEISLISPQDVIV